MRKFRCYVVFTDKVNRVFLEDGVSDAEDFISRLWTEHQDGYRKMIPNLAVDELVLFRLPKVSRYLTLPFLNLTLL
jgi:hypothetical protein